MGEEGTSNAILGATERDFAFLCEEFPFGAVAVFGEDLRYISVRGQGWADLGVDPRSFTGKSFDELWDEDTARRLSEMARDAFDGRRRTERFLYSGEFFDIWAARLPDHGSGRARGAFVSRNVTAEVSQLERARLLEVACDAASVGITLVDANRADYPLVYVNRGFEVLTGYTSAEVLGRNCRLLQAENTDLGEQEKIRRALADGHSATVELENVRKDGGRFRNRLGVSPVFSRTGEVTHYVGIQQDVTREFELEREANQARRLTELGLFAGSVAHDFNNLLMVLKTQIHLLSEVAAPPEISDGLGRLDEAVVRGSELVAQLMNYARRREEESRHGVASIREVVAGVRSLLPETVSLQLDLPANPARVAISPGRLEQVILNLAKNAADAMRHGGTLTIAQRDDDASEFTLISVADEGPGVPDALRQRVFDPFFSTKGDSGTGLGLSTVRRVVQAAGGSVELRSIPGEGAEFTLRLPKSSGPSSSTPDGADLQLKSTEPDAATRLLLAEDNAPLRKVMVTALRADGWHVTEARTGTEALELLSSQPFDAALLDNHMPHLDGEAVVRNYLQACSGGPTPQLALMSGEALPGLPEGILWYQKPFSVKQVSVEIRRAVRSSQERAP